MSTFVSPTSVLTAAEPDPTKHVLFQQGMVLGVDDFTQEFAYLSGRDQWLARDLLGYGTVAGLAVKKETDTNKGPRVLVEPGVALGPRGHLIRVPTAQCAYLNDWLKLEKTKQELLNRSSPQTVYVVLCYRDCATDNVPIPGEPCRSEDDLMKPSRLADDFELRLSFDPPSQHEDEAIREFVEWMRQVEISDAVFSSPPLEVFLKDIRTALQPLTSPPMSSSPAFPEFDLGSPPLTLQIRPEDACEYLTAAFRLWVTELRPKRLGPWRGCGATIMETASAAADDCVMLAAISFPFGTSLSGAIEVTNVDQIEINERHRPFLVHLRFLQEWVLCGRGGGTALPTDVFPSSPPSDLAEGPPPPSVGERIPVAVVDTPGNTSLNGQHHCVICDTQNGDVEISLPSTLFNAGRVYIIKRVDASANNLKISAASGDSIEPSPKFPLTAGAAVTIVADRKNRAWQIIAWT
jgi:hypothetical protein